MKEIQRYDWDELGGMLPISEGDYVKIEDYQDLVNLVNAVTSTEWQGAICNDVNGKNWFDERSRLT